MTFLFYNGCLFMSGTQEIKKMSFFFSHYDDLSPTYLMKGEIILLMILQKGEVSENGIQKSRC